MAVRKDKEHVYEHITHSAQFSDDSEGGTSTARAQAEELEDATSFPQKWRPVNKSAVRDHEKCTAGGHVPSDGYRRKYHHEDRDRRNTVGRGEREDEARAAGEREASRDRKEEEREASLARINVRTEKHTEFNFQPFIVRTGGFSTRWEEDVLSCHVADGSSLWRHVSNMRHIFSDRSVHIMEPVQGNQYRAFDPYADGIVATLKFRGLATLLSVSLVTWLLIVLMSGVVFLSSLFGFMTWAIAVMWWLFLGGIVFGLLFEVVERYASGDWMASYSEIYAHDVEVEEDPDQRNPSQRDTKITHRAVYGTVMIRAVVAQSAGNFLARGVLRLFGSIFFYAKYSKYFGFRYVNTERRIDLVLASHLLTVLQTSAARTYDQMLEVARTQALRVSTILRPDYRSLEENIIDDTCRYCSARRASEPREDFRVESPLPF